MSDLSEHNRDWKTPIPLTGKPVTKTYYDWTRRRWVTSTCILLGAREIPASVPYAKRAGNDAPSPYARKDEPEITVTPTMLRDQLIDYLRNHGPSTTQQVANALGIDVNHAVALLGRNPFVRPSVGNLVRGNPKRWELREGAK